MLSARMQALRTQVEEHRARLVEVTDTAEKRLRALMQQHEKLKGTYAERMDTAERSARRNATQRTKELERQLEEVRFIWY